MYMLPFLAWVVVVVLKFIFWRQIAKNLAQIYGWKVLIKIDICTNNIETKKYDMGIIHQFWANTTPNHHTLNTCNRCKNQPDGSQADVFPHKQHEHRRHGTQMKYMADIA